MIKLKNLFNTIEKPPVAVKGKQEELILFEVKGRK
jgi:hypothetical protein